MNIKYSVYYDNMEEACAIALKNRLFVPGWTMRDFLTFDKKKIRTACIAYVDDNPVAVGLVVREIPHCINVESNPNPENFQVDWFMVFVRKSYRRNGIASGIFKRVTKNKKKEKITVGRHNDGSCKFFDSLKHNLPQHPDFL